MPRRFVILDVFTRVPLAGNPLAVVLDAAGLDDRRMQAIAREFNLSETVFVLPPEDPRHRARLRIFTPARELPFAGHPTVGTAVWLAREGVSGSFETEDGPRAAAFGLEEGVGVVPCAVAIEEEGRGRARFRLPALPQVWGEGARLDEAAWALGLDPTEIGFDRHVPSRHAAGVPFDFVPVRSAAAVARARPNVEAFGQVFGADHGAVSSTRARPCTRSTPSTRGCSHRTSASPRTRRRVRRLRRSRAC